MVVEEKELHKQNLHLNQLKTEQHYKHMPRARMETLRTLGPTMSPMSAFLFLQGLETLPLRMDRHCSNTLAVAHFLNDHPFVSWVKYAGLPDNPYHELAQKYLPRGAGGVLTFGIKGGQDWVRLLMDKTSVEEI